MVAQRSIEIDTKESGAAVVRADRTLDYIAKACDLLHRHNLSVATGEFGIAARNLTLNLDDALFYLAAGLAYEGVDIQERLNAALTKRELQVQERRQTTEGGHVVAPSPTRVTQFKGY